MDRAEYSSASTSPASPEVSDDSQSAIDPTLLSYDDDSSANSIQESSALSHTAALREKRRTGNGIESGRGKAKRKAVAEVTDEDRSLERKFLTAVRWMYLVHFNGDDLSTVIEEVLGVTDKESPEYHSARSKVLELIKGYKHKSIDRMLEHIRKTKEIARKENGAFSMAASSDEKSLYEYFESRFTKESFAHVFFWSVPILDFDSSSALGQWFLKQIYANFAVKAKLHDDILEAGNVREAKGSRAELLSYWDFMTSRSEFSEVDKSCFAAKKADFHAERQKRQKASGATHTFIMNTSPPAKTTTPGKTTY